VTNFGWPVVPDVVSSTAGAWASGSARTGAASPSSSSLGQRLRPGIIDHAADNETCIRWDDRAIDRGDAPVEIRLADIEGGS